jgi:uncharacterized protein (TIGR02001 family)
LHPLAFHKMAMALAVALFALPLTALAQDASTQDASTQDAPTQPVDPAQATGEAAPAAPPAEEAKPALTWNLSVTSDYVFRGITQTDFQPALQGGLDYGFGDSGIYVGAWGSNVDFDDSDGPDIELDTYIGWSKDLAPGFNLDLSLVHYAYLGERDAYGSVNYNEFIAKGTWNEMLTFTVGYANDYSNAGYNSLYYNLGGTWDVGHGFNLNAGVGHTEFSDDVGSYNDWNLGVSRQFGPVNAALNYFDATGNVIDDAFGSHRASDSIVLSFAFGNG